MRALSIAALLDAWDFDRGKSAQARLHALVALFHGAAAVQADTLGARNLRLLALHRNLVGRPIEAQVACGHCGVQNEFELPLDAIMAAPPPDPRVRVRLRSGGRSYVFRLPQMCDLAAVGRTGDLRRAVAARCVIGGDAPDDEALDRLGRRFEALDPAANVIANLICAGCGLGLAATVEVAAFVARDLDRLVSGLMRDVDVIAAAYGWDESTIVALPPGRRARYVEMIVEARAPSRPTLVGRRS